MEVRVLFFAAYRELVGLRETAMEFPDGTRLQDVLARVLEAHPRLHPHRDSMILAVNEEFAEPETPLHNGDEVALLPPMSGGASTYCWLQTEPIDAAAVAGIVRDVRAGAVVLFLGTVRADPGVGALEYEAYEGMAVKKMENLRTAAKEEFEVAEMAIVHRTGRLPLGETSVAIACSAPHRQAAFRACEWAMEELKKVVPIWKTERDG
jgi:molybdopterin synthase catalytic subunit